MPNLSARLTPNLGQSTTLIVHQKGLTDALAALSTAPAPSWDAEALARLKSNPQGSFDYCNFQGADFSGVILNNSSFIGANLTGVNFNGVILRGAFTMIRFLDAQIYDASITSLLQNANFDASDSFVFIEDKNGDIWMINDNMPLAGGGYGKGLYSYSTYGNYYEGGSYYGY